MRKALMLGGGDNAKWLFRKLEEVQSDVIVIGMSGEKHWLQSERNVVGFVSASNIRGVISNLSVHKIDQVSFFGKPFSSLLWHDIPRLSTIIVGAVAKSKFKHPTKALPNVYFSTLDARLEKRAVPTFNIGELIPGAQALSGTVLGVEPKHDLLDVYKAALEHRKHKGLIWRKHGMLVLRNGQIFSEVAGTKTFLKDQADIQDLKGAVLVKAEVPEFKNLDVPVIDKKLVSQCSKFGVAAIVTESSAIVIDLPNLSKYAKSVGVSIQFI